MGLGMTDPEFASRLVGRFRQQMSELPASVNQIVVVAHHPPIGHMVFGRLPNLPDGWRLLARSGNREMEALVLSDPRVRFVVCGHTHQWVSLSCKDKICINVGGGDGGRRHML